MELGNGVEINFGKLTNDQLQAARGEVEAAGVERGLWVPEGVGSLATAETVEAPNLRTQLLDSVEAGARYFNGAVNFINAGRRKKNQIQVIEPGEYRERAQDWLTDERVVAASQLPATEDRPRLIIPRLSSPITTQEIVSSWGEASDHGLYSWSGRMKFLGNWTADQLSGFDPEQVDADRLTVIPTAYDENREGTVAEQTTNLEALQTEFPELDVATIFEGSLLARRYIGKNRSWEDIYVRGINLDPAKVDRFDFVPDAGVGDLGGAYVSGSDVDDDYAARLRVR